RDQYRVYRSDGERASAKTDCGRTAPARRRHGYFLRRHDPRRHPSRCYCRGHRGRGAWLRTHDERNGGSLMGPAQPDDDASSAWLRLQLGHRIQETVDVVFVVIEENARAHVPVLLADDDPLLLEPRDN